MSLSFLPAGFNIQLVYDDGACLFPVVLGSRRGWAGLGKGQLKLEPRGPQTQSSAGQCQLSLLMAGGFVPFTLPTIEFSRYGRIIFLDT